AIAAVGDRAGAGDHDHARAVAESGFESDDIVSHHFYSARNDLRDDASYHLADLWPGCAGEADADAADLGRVEMGNRAGLPDGASQRLARLRFAHPDHVAGPAGSCAQYGGFVADQARSLAAAAVDAEEDGHERSSTIRVCFGTQTEVPAVATFSNSKASDRAFPERGRRECPTHTARKTYA